MQITLAGGCFWCVEAALKDLRGIEACVSGYAGGETDDPTYEQVCSGRTGHAEVVRVTFDESEISLGDLLEIFFTIHDPTTLNRQGADRGTQYRSAIFVEDDAQRSAAEDAIARAQPTWGDKIVTTIEPLDRFWQAEEHHQDYYARNPTAGYCAVVIAPKVAKMRKKWADRLA